MIVKRLIATLLVVILLIALTPFMQIQKAEAPTPTLSTCPVPETALTVGGKWDGSFMWLASYKYGALYKVNMTTCNYVQYYYLGVNDTSFSVRFRGMDMDANGNFWIVRLLGGLVFFDKSTSTFQDIISVSWQAQNVKVISGKVYVGADLGGPFAANDKLYIVDVATKTVESEISLTGGTSTAYDGYVQVGTNIWIADNENGRLVRYSTANGTIKDFSYPSQLNQPLGMDYQAPYLYVADEIQTRVVAINPQSGEFVKNYAISGRPYMIKAVSFLGQDFVVYSTWDGLVRGVGVLNLTITAHTTSVYYCDYDSLANKVYCAYHGSPAGALQGSNFLPSPEPGPEPQPPAQKPGEGDQRQPIGAINLSGDFMAKKGQSLNITISLIKNVSGTVYLYAGENYLGMELIALKNMANSTLKTISFKPDWVGSKPVFAKYSGDAKYKGNVSNYITLTSVIAKTGIGTIKSSVSIVERDIVVSIKNTDSNYMQNTTMLAQIKNERGEVVYLAWVRNLQLIPDSAGSIGFGFADNIPRGLIEVFVWKSLEEAIPLAEVQKLRS